MFRKKVNEVEKVQGWNKFKSYFRPNSLKISIIQWIICFFGNFIAFGTGWFGVKSVEAVFVITMFQGITVGLMAFRFEESLCKYEDKIEKILQMAIQLHPAQPQKKCCGESCHEK